MTNTFGAKGKLDYAAEGMAARDAGEPVTAARWAGIALIVGGVFLVSRS